MRTSFAKNNSPMIIGVVRQRSVRDAIADAKNCELHGATGIDLHLSCLDDNCKNVESISEIAASVHKPILALNYNQDYEYNDFETDEESRVDLLLKAVEAGVSAIDIQGYTFDLQSKGGFRQEFLSKDYSFIKGNPREIVVDEKIIEKQMDLIERVHSMGAEVLLSTHPFIPMCCEQVVDLALFLEKRNPDVLKIITRCDNEEQLAESFKTMIVLKKEIKTPIHFHCCGSAGKLSRVINPILGGYLAFCCDGYHAGSNFEQPDLKTMAKIISLTERLK